MTDVLFGKVFDTKDKDGLGRVKVELLGFGAQIKTPWIRVLQQVASKKGGTYLVPNKGDHVVVLQGPGGADGMIVIGAFYTGKTKPEVKDKDGKNAIKQIASCGGAMIKFDDTKGKESVSLELKDGKFKVLLDAKTKSVVVESAGKVTIKAKDKITVEGKDIVIVGKGKVSIKGAQGVKIECSAKVDIKGGMVLIKGSLVKIG